MKNAGMTVALVVTLFVVVAGSALIYHFLEWEKPQIKIVESFDMIGQKKNISIKVSDARSGVSRITVSLTQKDRTYDVASFDIPEQGEFQKDVTVEVSPRKLKMANGPAVFQVKATDHSPLRNNITVQRNVTIDTVPLNMSLLTMTHNVNPGGTCLVAYTVSKPALKSGVICGDKFFPGYPETSASGKTYYVCYVAVPMDVSSATVMNITAADKAGNQSVTPVSFYIRRAHIFRDDTLGVSAAFVNRKASEFLQDYPDLEGKPTEIAFTMINDTIRKENENTIRSTCLKTSPQKLWEDTFIMMRNGATRARFGDKRTYKLDGKVVGGSMHMGIDVASTERAPIEAFNSGTVIFTGRLGIYGNTVILDHGQGIASLYAHLSSIQAAEGEQVQKGQVIANSGATGWAGGDHLHFSMLVNGVFVNPIEWWDAHWIRDNVQRKMEDVQSYL